MVGDRYFAVDVETANAGMHSICQIGMVGFEDGSEFFAQSWLIDPEDYFDGMNVSIHGITADTVRGSPRFVDLILDFEKLAEDAVWVAHTHFDRVAFGRASQRCGAQPPPCVWLDSAKVTRRTWPEFSKRGYGLKNITKHLGIEFKHHDALEDARAAGLVLQRAMELSGCGIEEWIARASKPISPQQSEARTGGDEGPLAGETIVFTGALEMVRREAADLASQLGANVGTSVTKATTIMVVGDTDISKLAGHSKSSKHRKAEDLIEAGQPIRIVGETDFRAMTVI